MPTDHKCACQPARERCQVELPEHIRAALSRSSRMVHLDECIADTIVDMWHADVVTIGCCCGHNASPPSVVLHADSGREQLSKTQEILEADGRPWLIWTSENGRQAMPTDETMRRLGELLARYNRRIDELWVAHDNSPANARAELVDFAKSAAPLFTSERHSLECPHCGDVAIWADANGCYHDGDGGKCISCGYPGAVSCDSETAPWWNDCQDAGSHCNRVDCEECREEIAKLFALKLSLDELVGRAWEP